VSAGPATTVLAAIESGRTTRSDIADATGLDPDVVDAAFKLEEELQAIARRYMDSDEELHAKAKQMELKV